MRLPGLALPPKDSMDADDAGAARGCHGYGICCFSNRTLSCCGDRAGGSYKDDDVLVVELEETAIPYVGKLEGLKAGDVVTVQGRVHPECERFSINLCCKREKEGTESDIALHFNPRLSQRYVVRTSRFGGRWDTEETAACFPFPFKRGDAFAIDIFVADDAFYCQTNSDHFCTFAFRTPCDRINELEVRGTGVSVGIVQRGVARSYPARPITMPAPPPVPKYLEETDIKWGNPAIGILQDGFREGRQLVIIGKIKLLPHSFYINLQSSVQMWPHPDIPLHINPRFMAGRKHVIIRNAWQLGSWGDEERMETSHLSPGTNFELSINSEQDHYSVWIKDNLIGTFKYRLNAECVRAVHIQGDVHIHHIYQRDTPYRSTMMYDES